MAIDRYTKVVLTVIALALGVIAFRPWVGPEALTPAPALAQSGPQYTLTIPRAWGKVVDYDSGNLLLEGADGTLREVDIRGKAPEYPRIKSQVTFGN
jgi:hypothetical protein